MAHRFYLLDGAYHCLLRGERLPKGARALPRLPGEAETWNEAKGKFVVDEALLADRSVPIGHIERAHAQKAIEALLILSGHQLVHGLLAEETKATGVTIEDLAKSVHRNAAKFRATETARRMAKTSRA